MEISALQWANFESFEMYPINNRDIEILNIKNQQLTISTKLTEINLTAKNKKKQRFLIKKIWFKIYNKISLYQNFKMFFSNSRKKINAELSSKKSVRLVPDVGVKKVKHLKQQTEFLDSDEEHWGNDF